MTEPRASRPTRPLPGFRLALLTSEFNRPVTDAMRRTARARAASLQATVVVDERAPGVYDMPLLAHVILRRPDVDGLVALGAVVTGETKHDEVVTQNAARLLADLALRHEKPVGLGITGPGQTQAQARARIDRAARAVESVVKQFRTVRGLLGPDGSRR